jgi:hypothetical protein
MKLRERVLWLMGTLPRHLFPRLEEGWERPLSDKEQQSVSILELVHIEKFVVSPSPQRFGRKRHDRRVLARALTAASVHDSQEAIPLMKTTSERLDYLYDLMDAAYDAQPI